MPRDRKRPLLLMLAAAACLSGLSIAVFLGMDRLSTARSTINLYGQRIAAITRTMPAESALRETRDRLQALLAEEKGRFYRADEMNPYAFGTLIKKRLSDLGMDIARYQVVDAKGKSYLEFTASGSAPAVVGFLRDASRSGKKWDIPALTIKAHEDADRMDVVFRIGYEVLDGEGR